jgi:hypothetical protein
MLALAIISTILIVTQPVLYISECELIQILCIILNFAVSITTIWVFYAHLA